MVDRSPRRYKRKPEEAESILLQASPPLLYRAIKMHLRLFKWDKALELAVKHRTHVDTVLAYRAKYLEAWKKTETDDRFKQLNDTVKWDWKQVKEKKDLEKREELARKRRVMNRLYGKAEDRRSQKIISAWRDYAAPRAEAKRMKAWLRKRFLVTVLRSWLRYARAARRSRARRR